MKTGTRRETGEPPVAATTEGSGTSTKTGDAQQEWSTTGTSVNKETDSFDDDIRSASISQEIDMERSFGSSDTAQEDCRTLEEKLQQYKRWLPPYRKVQKSKRLLSYFEFDECPMCLGHDHRAYAFQRGEDGRIVAKCRKRDHQWGPDELFDELRKVSQGRPSTLGPAPEPPPPPDPDPWPECGDPVIDRLNRKHFVLNVKGKVSVATWRFNPGLGIHELELSRPRDFREMYRHEKVRLPRAGGGSSTVNVATYWLQHRRRRHYIGVTFLPEKRAPKGWLNLWTGFAVKPRKGDCSLYWRHVRDVICNGDEELYRYVRKWMAHAVQRPYELPRTALVLRGPQGSGKDLFVKYFGQLFGRHFLPLYSMEQVAGRFNAHLQDALIVQANEALWGGDRSKEGLLKGLVTDATVPIEAKGQNIQNLPNCRRLIVTTNNEFPVARDPDDRRFLVLDVSGAMQGDEEYFEALVTCMETGGLRAVLHQLMNEDLSEFVPGRLPQSQGGFDIKLESAHPVLRWWFDRLQEGASGF